MPEAMSKNKPNEQDPIANERFARTNAETDADRAAKAISERVPPGGGCCEAWEATSELRDDTTNTTTRRGMIKKAASALGVSVAGLTALTNEVEAAKNEDVARKLHRGDRKQALAAALSDSRTKQIRGEFLDAGYRPAVNEAYTVRSNHEGRQWDTVVIPFRDGEPTDEIQTYITWSNNPEYEVQVAGYHIVHREPDDEEAYWDVTSYRVADGEVLVETDQTPNFLGCNNISWGCVLTLAGAYSGTIAACGSCVASSGWLVWACAACVSAILSAGGATLLCPWCKD